MGLSQGFELLLPARGPGWQRTGLYRRCMSGRPRRGSRWTRHRYPRAGPRRAILAGRDSKGSWTTWPPGPRHGWPQRPWAEARRSRWSCASACVPARRSPSTATWTTTCCLSSTASAPPDSTPSSEPSCRTTTRLSASHPAAPAQRSETRICRSRWSQRRQGRNEASDWHAPRHSASTPRVPAPSSSRSPTSWDRAVAGQHSGRRRSPGDPLLGTTWTHVRHRHPREGRITDLALHRTIDPQAGDQVRIDMWWEILPPAAWRTP